VGFFEAQFQAVSEWCTRTGRQPGFPTCENEQSPAPHVLTHRVIVFNPGVAERRLVPVANIGDPTHTDPNWVAWRQRFTSANLFAHSAGFFDGFPDFTQDESEYEGTRLGVILLREATGVTWQDVPALELLPPPDPLTAALDPAYFVSYPAESWLQLTNQWAREHGFVAGIPTGWIAEYAGTWVVGVVLLGADAASSQLVDGTELMPAEVCGQLTNSDGPTAPGQPSGSGNIFVGVAAPAPLAVDDAPFGGRLFADAADVDWVRCMATRLGSVTVGLANHATLTMAPRTDGRTLVYFANFSQAGTWIVGHRLNTVTIEDAGEVVSFWLGQGSQETFAFEPTQSGLAAPGQVSVHSVGFVTQGIAGIAQPVMSFAWSTYMRLSPGMNLAFTWIQ